MISIALITKKFNEFEVIGEFLLWSAVGFIQLFCDDIGSNQCILIEKFSQVCNFRIGAFFFWEIKLLEILPKFRDGHF